MTIVVCILCCVLRAQGCHEEGFHGVILGLRMMQELLEMGCWIAKGKGEVREAKDVPKPMNSTHMLFSFCYTFCCLESSLPMLRLFCTLMADSRYLPEGLKPPQAAFKKTGFTRKADRSAIINRKTVS